MIRGLLDKDDLYQFRIKLMLTRTNLLSGDASTLASYLLVDAETATCVGRNAIGGQAYSVLGIILIRLFSVDSMTRCEGT